MPPLDQPVDQLTAETAPAGNDLLYLMKAGTRLDRSVDPDHLVTDERLVLADVTTNNSGTTKHGFLKKLSNIATEFMNGQGNWATPAGGGTVTTTGAPANGNLTKFSGATSITNGDLSGDVSTSGGLATTIGAGKVTEAMQVLADNTTNDVSTSKHGYAPKAPNDATKFLNGVGAYSVPAGSGSGKVAQVVNTQTGAVATGTTTMPFDDTIPQNTEGDQYMTLSITPTSATNKLRIDVVAVLSASVLDNLSAALFQDSTANALAAASIFISADTAVGVLVFTHYMTAGTTSATTFKVRAGKNGAGTTTFNGQSGARKFGGVVASSITITEIAP